VKAPFPPNESDRLASLGQYEILDTPAEREFNDLAFLAAHICQTPIAMVSLIDEKRQWFKATVGLDLAETSRDTAFCAYTILQPGEILEVKDAQTDERFADNPFVRSDPHIRFYAGAPLLAADGQAIGTLCVMDRKPRSMTAEQIAALAALSRAVGAQLELRKQGRVVAKEKEKADHLLAVAEKARRALLSVLEDEKIAAQALRSSEQRFRRLIENSSDVIMVIDETGCVEFQSPSTQRILGYEPAQLMGKNVLDLIHSDDRHKVEEGMRDVLAGVEAPRAVEYRIHHHDETWRVFQSMGKRMDGTNGKKIVVNSRDVTESRQMEEKFLRAQRMEAIGTLASGVAHDLNNILTPMLMVAGLLKETLVESRDREMLTMVERSAQRGAAIIGQLLTFSRGIEGTRTSVQPRHLVKEMINLMQETFPRNIEVIQDLPTDLWSVVVDATQFHQVLLNLCVNARDAMPEGGKLTLAARNLYLTEKDIEVHSGVTPGPHLLVTVADTGHGIPSLIVGRIFDPFFTTKKTGKGTGLGLSTVIGIVKSHKGFVNVYSEPGSGTVFRVYLPATDSTMALESRETTSPFVQGNGESVLVVDDEPHILSALRGVLEKHNYRALTAENGEQAIRIFIEQAAVIKLVVTDVMMPVMGGLALINTLRVLKADVRVIATTGLEQEEKTAEFSALGVSAILAKPFSPSVLLRAVDEALRGSERYG
jgi:PAS domain S-box-containing protein